MVYLFGGKKRKLQEVGEVFPQHLLRAGLTSGSDAQGTNRERVADFCVWIVNGTLPLGRISAAIGRCALLRISLPLPYSDKRHIHIYMYIVCGLISLFG